jgi:hypothetical protein
VDAKVLRAKIAANVKKTGVKPATSIRNPDKTPETTLPTFPENARKLETDAEFSSPAILVANQYVAPTPNPKKIEAIKRITIA